MRNFKGIFSIASSIVSVTENKLQASSLFKNIQIALTRFGSFEAVLLASYWSLVVNH